MLATKNRVLLAKISSDICGMNWSIILTVRRELYIMKYGIILVK